MATALHSIELEQNGEVFATFRNEQEYDEYLGDLAIDYHDGDFELNTDYKVWYCVFKNGELISLTESEYVNFNKGEQKDD